MDDLTASYASEYERLCEEGGFAVCRLDLRGTGSSEGIATRRVHAGGARRHLRRDRLARRRRSGRTGGSACTARRGPASTRSRSLPSARRRSERSCRSTPPTTATPTTSTTWAACSRRSTSSTGCSTWSACNALPPVPAVFGEGWRDEWLRRLDGTEPWLLRWLEEQVDGPYWRHGSLRPGLRADHLPDDDRRRLGRRLPQQHASGRSRRSRCPKRLLIGPWSHMSTATSLPGPHIDLVPELIRWFGRWLRDDENGIDERAADRGVRAPLDATRARPRRDARRVAGRADVAARAARRADAVARPETAPTTIHVRGDVGRTAWISCAGQAPLGPAGRPARRRRSLADLRLGAARGRARHDGAPPSAG